MYEKVDEVAQDGVVISRPVSDSTDGLRPDACVCGGVTEKGGGAGSTVPDSECEFNDAQKNGIDGIAYEDWDEACRPYLRWIFGNSFGGLEAKNQFHVYAEAGDTICLGSNIYNAGYDLDGKSLTNGYKIAKFSYPVVTYNTGSAGEDLENQVRDTNSGRTKTTTKYGVIINNSSRYIYAKFGESEYRYHRVEGHTVKIYSGKDNSTEDITTYDLINKAECEQGTCSCPTDLLTESKHNDKDSVDIVMYAPDGTPSPIDIRNSDGYTTGYISSPEVEYAARLLAYEDGEYKGTFEYGKSEVAEYTPYTYEVLKTGIYTFEFRPFDGAGNADTGTGRLRSEQWPKAENGCVEPGANNTGDYGSLIAAWDITVFNEEHEKKPGRTYADYLALQMYPKSGSTGIMDTYHILTSDSYIYTMSFNNATPYTYNFFSNNRGLIDIATSDTLYKSVKDINNKNQFNRMGVTYNYPGGAADDELVKNFHIFFEHPSKDLKGVLYEKPLAPEPATNVKFEGKVIKEDGSEVTGAYVGQGGYFSFDVGNASTATLRLEFTQEGEEEPKTVEISGVVTPNSKNYFYWDGKDADGKEIPAGVYKAENIKYTVTTKAGEIHFPIFDMEHANGGITFTRESHIFDSNGEQLDTESSIYELTKHAVYYDDTAIYYGENAASTGLSEGDVTGLADTNDSPALTSAIIKKFFSENKDSGRYWLYYNMLNGTYTYNTSTEKTYAGGEAIVRNDVSNYVEKNALRVGDHSHTNNSISFFKEEIQDDGSLVYNVRTYMDLTEEEKQLLQYLDSKKHPVAKSNADGNAINAAIKKSGSTGSGEEVVPDSRNSGFGQTVTDYAIVDFWTFIPSRPITGMLKETEQIEIIEEENSFSLIGRVFYDAQKSGETGYGTFNSETDHDRLLKDVTVELYVKSDDTGRQEGKNYATYEAGKLKKLEEGSAWPSGTTVYELMKRAKTDLLGKYVFTGLKYDPDQGTEYLYHVVKPSEVYSLTSESIKVLEPSSIKYGYYSLYVCDGNNFGTETQRIKVGGTGGVNPKSKSTNTVAAVDVGYHYDLWKALSLKKDWNIADSSGSSENPVVFEVSYLLGGESGTASTSHLYKYYTLSSAGNWGETDNYLPDASSGAVKIKDYYVSAEYYIYGTKVFMHRFDSPAADDDPYKPDNSDHYTYPDYVAMDWYFDLNENADKIVNLVPDWSEAASYTWQTFPDLNRDGVSDASDLGEIGMTAESAIYWREALPAGSDLSGEGVVSPFKAVLEREQRSDESTITIHNSENSGTIEIIKYTGAIEDRHYLEGATFYIYEGTKDDVKSAIANNTAASLFVSGATTQEDGRVVFYDLDPEKTYTIRERYAPVGYRIDEEYYQVDPVNTTYTDEATHYQFDEENHHCRLWIANSDSKLTIQKRIEGRSWQSGDTFTFTVALDTSRGDGSSDIVVSENEKTLNSEYEGLLEEFRKNFNAKKEVVDNSNDYYSTKSSTGKITISTDTKVSNILLNEAQKDTSSTTWSEPTLCGVPFTVEGTYYFKVTENELPDWSTLTKSPREYSVTIDVTRVMNDPESSEAMSLTNSHLEATVSEVQYRDLLSRDSSGAPTYTDSKIYKSSSLRFTNVYSVSAAQATPYGIYKDFTGRPANEWLNTDVFTFVIKAGDDATGDALAKKQIKIEGLPEGVTWQSGLDGYYCEVKIGGEDSEKAVLFHQIDFEDIEFPVKWVDADGNVVESPTEDQINHNEVSLQTLPVTYSLVVTEKAPEGSVTSAGLAPVYEGITYDLTQYTLEIELKNSIEESGAAPAASGDPADGEVDGIIDEMIFRLYKGDTTKELVAECTTVQTVIDGSQWKKDSNSEARVTWWYIDADGNLRNGADYNDAPFGAQKLIRREETHASEEKHKMTFSNSYNASCTWEPEVQKTLNGRAWMVNDEFTFTIERTEGPEDGVTMPDPALVTITKDTLDYKAKFEPLTFTKPGNYTFKVTESHSASGITSAEQGECTVTVTIVDEGKGILRPEFSTNILGDTSQSPVIQFTNTYADTARPFGLSLQKTLTGREWESGDAFTFTIEPDDAAKAAIENRTIVMPEGLEKDEDGNYTVTITNRDPKGTAAGMFEKSLGNIQITQGAETKKTYTFTIRETDLESDMKCEYPNVVLTITVERKTALGSGLPAGTLDVTATYAYLSSSGDTSGSSDPVSTQLTIPFTNVYAPSEEGYTITKTQSINGEESTGEKQFVKAEDQVKYEITVKNIGTGLLRNLVITDPVPDGLIVDSTSISDSGMMDPETGEDRTITWKIPSLAAGETVTCSFTVTVPNEPVNGVWKNIASVRVGDNKPKESTPVEIEKRVVSKEASVNNDSVKVGDTFTYTIHWANSTDGEADVIITDTLEDGLDFVSARYQYGKNKDDVLVATPGNASVKHEEPGSSRSLALEAQSKVFRQSSAADGKENEPSASPESSENGGSKLPPATPGDTGEPVSPRPATPGDTAEPESTESSSSATRTLGSRMARLREYLTSAPEVLEEIKYDETTKTVTWTLHKRPESSEGDVILEVRVNKKAGYQIKNTAHVVNKKEGEPEDPGVDTNEVVTKVVKELTIEKSQKVNNEPQLSGASVESGDVVTYELTVTNNGKEPVSGAEVKDTVPDGLILLKDTISEGGILDSDGKTIVWTITEPLGANESVTLSFQVEVPEVDESHTWTNVAYVKTGDDPEEWKPSDSVEITEEVTTPPPVIPSSDVSVTKTQSVNGVPAAEVKAGDRVTYELTVTNSGKGDAAQVEVRDTVPAGLILDEASITEGGVLTEEKNSAGETVQTITWTVKDLAAGQSVTLEFTVKVPAVTRTTTWTNVAAISIDDDGDPDTPPEEKKSNDVVLKEEPEKEPEKDPEKDRSEVSVTKTQSVNGVPATEPAEVKAGDTVTYELTVTNSGKGTAAQVEVRDTVPAGLILNENSIKPAGKLTEETAAGETVRTITWTVEDLAAGESVTFTFTVEVPAVTRTTEWRNVAAISIDDDGDPETPPEEKKSNEVVLEEELEKEPGKEPEKDRSDVSVTKAQSVNGVLATEPAEVKAGDTVTYELTVTNSGKGDAAQVEVRDTVPAGLILDEDSITEGGVLTEETDAAGGTVRTITWTVEDLAANESVTLAFTVEVPTVTRKRLRKRKSPTRSFWRSRDRSPISRDRMNRDRNRQSRMSRTGLNRKPTVRRNPSLRRPRRRQRRRRRRCRRRARRNPKVRPNPRARPNRRRQVPRRRFPLSRSLPMRRLRRKRVPRSRWSVIIRICRPCFRIPTTRRARSISRSWKTVCRGAT